MSILERQGSDFGAVDYLKTRDVSVLGYYAGENDWKYPLWKFLSDHAPISLRRFKVEAIRAV